VSDPNFLSDEELLGLGFSAVGERVRASRKSSFYAISGSVGSDVRIDDFCVLKGRVEIGSHVHIAAHCLVSGARGLVRLGDFSSLSARVSVYTGSDDYGSDRLSGANVPDRYTKTIAGDVQVGRSALIGAHSVVLPGVTIGDAAAIGALCVVYKDVPAGHYLVGGAAELRLRRERDVKSILALAEDALRNDGTR
jgi:acetyltransferase-like isoleucine patch superfamily enzyme